MRYLKNLVSIAASEGKPWEFRSDKIPENVRKDKAARTKWITNPKTEHNCYFLISGVNPNGRVTAPRAREEGNAAHTCYGLVADYDVQVADDALQAGLERMQHLLPSYYEKTLSGNVRLLWEFEQPIVFPSHGFAVAFLKYLPGALGLDKIAPGFDRPAFEDPCRTYTNSGEWFEVSKARVPAALVLGWLFAVSSKTDFTGKEYGAPVKLEEIIPALRERYPRFSEWGEDFALGAQGPSFWLEGSFSPKSAVVRESGMQTFAAHASKGFYSWADLLGAAFVDKATATSIGTAVTDVYYDGHDYYRKTPDGIYKAWTNEELKKHLAVTRKISSRPDKSGISDLDRAIEFIRDNQRVEGAGPFVFRSPGILFNNHQKVLNTYGRRVIPPAAEVGVWGAEGNFPFISELLSEFFDPVDQLAFFLSWLSYGYKHAYKMHPRSGQNVFIAGPVGVGKTLLNSGILARLFGGSADASRYLRGEEKFGSHLFEVGFWPIDDGSSATDYSTKKLFTEMVKKMAANRTFEYHPKFRTPMNVEWQGRILITCNCDEESIRMLPDLDMSTKDKLMLFRASARKLVFPKQDHMEEILDREVPYFASWLLTYEIPTQCQGDSRFGVKEYHEASLLETADQSSRNAAFNEILHDWRETYFKMEPGKEYWDGTALQLQKSILQCCGEIVLAMREYSVDAIGRALVTLKNRGANIECYSEDDVRRWKIYPLKKVSKNGHTTAKELEEEISAVGGTVSRFAKV